MAVKYWPVTSAPTLMPPIVMVRLGRFLDSAVITTWAESRISHGLLVVKCWLTDPSADVALASIVLLYHLTVS
jgi:hypothetical protein